MSMDTERPLETERRSISLPDGRKADMLIAGPSDGLPLVLHEGTPVGLVLYPPTVRAGPGRRTISWPDGRKADMLIAAPSDGLPLVLHEGTPVGLVLYPPTVRAAQVRGLRVILAARPGYEGSTPRPGRRVADVAGDTAAVLDELGADTFVTAGWSGGGPHPLRSEEHTS